MKKYMDCPVCKKEIEIVIPIAKAFATCNDCELTVCFSAEDTEKIKKNICGKEGF